MFLTLSADMLVFSDTCLFQFYRASFENEPYINPLTLLQNSLKECL